MGYLSLLRTTEEIPTIASSYVQGAQNSAAHLLTVINDLLDFSQIQQGKLVFTPQIVRLHQMLTETHQTLAPKAAELALDYSLVIDTTVPHWVRIDPHRFAQIFLNLLGNALKFTERGFVRTHVQFIKENNQADAGTLMLQVKDSGVGIPEKSLMHIFEPFVQLDNQSEMENDNSLRGNGLGLSITRALLKNLGGEISIQSKVGEGSIF